MTAVHELRARRRGERGRRRRSRAVAISLGLICVLSLRPATAQFRQYTPPGAFAEERESIDERLAAAMEGARWRFGRVYLDPWLGLRDVSYVDNAQTRAAGVDSDVTATLGAGLRLYRPIRSELVFAAHALPEYSWWSELSDRNQLNGRYGAGVFGNLGRTRLELSATRVEEARFFSREIEELTNALEDRGSVELEVDLGAGISLVGRALFRDLSFTSNAEPAASDRFVALDREEEILRASVKFDLPRDLSIAVGVEDTAVDFESVERDRSNSGLAPIAQLEIDGRVVFASAAVALRDLEPDDGSDFVPFDEVTGDVQLGIRAGSRAELQLFTSSQLVYAAAPEWVYFEDRAVGLGVRTSLGSRASLRVYVERGANEYVAVGAESPVREDDFDTVGGDLRLRLGRLTLVVGGASTDYDSNLPGFDREVTTVRTGITVGRGGASPWG